MKILLTGANGYIGKKLLPALIKEGHQVICCVRNASKLPSSDIYSHKNVSVIEFDFLKGQTPPDSIIDIDVAYYLMHSMTGFSKGFVEMEEKAAYHFLSVVNRTSIKQIIYLGGITNEDNLSQHLSSRKNVETILRSSAVPVTTLKAGIIVGCGSASFEIIRSLMEKLPVIIGPKWLDTQSQPVSLINVIEYLTGVLLMEETFNKSYDMGGENVITYKKMLEQYAEFRGYKRYIITMPSIPMPVAAFFVSVFTSSDYSLSLNLIRSMKVKVVAENNPIEKKLGIKPLSYKEALERCCGFPINRQQNKCAEIS
ncbi:NAD(P)H-binding protein [Natronoflexus pectinivorans]|uniref:Uncharacterized protein YbjT (DUF2867 family) n=1 Tax=Natronoflexus pectinivorans TaxID=682526 RepID=A0A4R2GK66_9BACT|nr:NAD(P)H-binding protein [Natronoflexus pectinivorans]TCO09194.1 uncharacterized protein YbjT (DUF2867 family) [Natronoflexus pectinivorans]